jgi:hypothetical protein
VRLSEAEIAAEIAAESAEVSALSAVSARDRLFKVFAADSSAAADSGSELLVDIRRESSEMNGLNYNEFDSELNKKIPIGNWN